jgi:type VI secretion system FHA domain protein
MPLILRVKSYREQPLTGRYCEMASGSITLGRAVGNDLVLDDPGKYISRIHARVEQRGEQYYLTDIGSNPSVVNDRLVGKGQEVLLEEGDVVVIGEYRLEIQVQAEKQLCEDDPASQTQSLTLAVFEPTPLIATPPLPAVETALPTRPDSALPLTLSARVPDALTAARILENGTLIEAELPLADPLGLNLFAQSHEAQMPRLESPRETLLRPVYRGAESDHLSPELQALPTPISKLAPTQVVMPLLIPADYDPLSDFLSAPAPSPVSVEPTIEQTPTPNPTLTPTTSSSDEGVLQALLDGLGLPNLRSAREPHELARLVGGMLREAVGGTMDVLMARALTKRDSHIDMTMIGARSNNPLKFFPNPESALSQMLSADAPAYLPGVNALAAAFDDLKAHELAVIVGMRAALAEVVQRFEPARIEQRLAVPGRLDKFMPGTRKARLWDLLTALYAELVRDGDEDVQRIFGEKFALAYQQQIARLRAAR